MLDVITFYKPIWVVAEEHRPAMVSAAALTGVFIAFAAFSASIGFALSFFSVQEFRPDPAIAIFSALAFALVQVPVASAVIFAFSRVFSKSGSLENLVSNNYFVLASCSLLMLVVFLPLFMFAGSITLALGAVLYLFFLEGLFENTFKIGPVASIAMLLFYVFISILLYIGASSILGQVSALIKL